MALWKVSSVKDLKYINFLSVLAKTSIRRFYFIVSCLFIEDLIGIIKQFMNQTASYLGSRRELQKILFFDLENVTKDLANISL